MAICIVGGDGRRDHLLHPLSALLLFHRPLRALRCRGVRAGARSLSRSPVFRTVFGMVGPLLLTLGIGVHFARWWQSPQTMSGGLKTLFHFRLPFPPLAMAAAAAYGAFTRPCAESFKGTWLAATFTFAAMAYFASLTPVLADIDHCGWKRPFISTPYFRRVWNLPRMERVGSGPNLVAATNKNPCTRLRHLLRFGISRLSLARNQDQWPDCDRSAARSRKSKSWIEKVGSDSRLILESDEYRQ